MHELLKNEMIRLRSPEPEDLELLYEMENDVHLWNVGNSIQPYSRYVLRRYLEESKQDIYVDKQVRFVIELTDGSAIGMVDIIDFDPHNKRAEVCIGLLERYRGKGYGYSALSLMGGYAFRFLQLNQLYAYITKDNTHSRRLFKKAGYKENAILKDWKFLENRFCDVVITQLFKAEIRG